MLSCMVLIKKYGHWSTELKKTTMDIVSLSKGLLLHKSVRYCDSSGVNRLCCRTIGRRAGYCAVRLGVTKETYRRNRTVESCGMVKWPHA